MKKEAAHIRDLFREGDTAFRRWNITKLLFFHMNGYPTDFGMTECIKLCASPKFADKRVAYLGLMILVDETQSILMLMTNSLKQDLNSNQLHIVALALTVLGNTATEEMTRDLLPEIIMHVGSRDPFIRRKAIMAAVRACRKLPGDETGDFVGMLRDLFAMRSIGVQLSATTLVQTLSSQPLTNHEHLASVAVPLLASSMESSLEDSENQRGRSSGGDGNTVTPRNPFQQVKTLIAWRKVITSSGKPTQSQIDDIMSHVGHILSTVSSAKVLGCSVLYEAIRTVLALPMPPQNSKILVLVINTLRTFLEHKDASVRYIALDLFSKLPRDTLPAIRKHLPTIVACLDEPDPTMRRCAVGLAHILADETNVAALADRLLEHVEVLKDADDVANACEKIIDMVEQHARHGPGGPDQADMWQVDVFVRLLDIVDDKMPEKLVGYFLAKLSCFSAEAQAHAAKFLYDTAFVRKEESRQRGQRKASSRSRRRLRRVTCYVYGEYGSHVVDLHSGIVCLDTVLDGTRSLRHIDDETIELRLAALMALVKLAARRGISGSPNRLAIEAGKATDTSGGNDLLASMGLLTITGPDSEKEQSLSLVPATTDLVQANGQASGQASGQANGKANTSDDLAQHILHTIGKWRDCAELETQQRACEYYSLLDSNTASPNLLTSALSKMPPMDYKAIKRRAQAEARGDSLQMMAGGDGDLLLDMDPHSSNELESGTNIGFMLENGPSNTELALVEAAPAGGGGVPDLLSEMTGGLIGSENHKKPDISSGTDLDDMLGLEPSVVTKDVENNTTTSNLANNLTSTNFNNNSTGDELLAFGAPEVKDPKKGNDPDSFGPPNISEPTLKQQGPEQFGEVSIHESEALKVTMAFSREDPSEPGRICGKATFINRSMSMLSNFAFKLSVRKYIKLQLKPASSRSIAPGGSANQVVYFTNSLHGSQPIEMLYLIEYVSSNGVQVKEKGMVKNLPHMT